MLGHASAAFSNSAPLEQSSGAQMPKRRPTLRSSRLAAVRRSGASAPRASQVQVSVWSAREGRERLSERTLARHNSTASGVQSYTVQLAVSYRTLWTPHDESKFSR